MIIIPAIDIKNGKCVRLLQGDMEKETIFSNAPYEMALKWEKKGAEIIHIVDLDGAIEKTPKNLNTIKKILKTVKVPIQLGGGIRDMHTIAKYIEIGVSKIIIGTEAIKNPNLVKEACKEFPKKIIVGIDAKNGFVAIEGWTEITKITATKLAKSFENFGVYAINFTDIDKDGMQSGPNILETKKLAQDLSIPVVASGGVSNIEDIKNLLSIEKYGVTGVISGRALYEGTLLLEDAIKVLRPLNN